MEKKNPEWLRHQIKHRIKHELHSITAIEIDGVLLQFRIEWWEQASAYRARLVELDRNNCYQPVENNDLSKGDIEQIGDWMKEEYGLDFVHIRADAESEDRVWNLIGRPTIIRV